MSERSAEPWRAALARLDDADAEGAVEAGAWALVLHAFDALEARPEVERARMREALAGALAEVEEPLATELGRAALAALNGDAPTHWPAELMRPSPRRLLKLLRGELDGFAAARVAGWLAAHPDERATLEALLEAGASARSEPLPVAAASSVRMRDPEEGQLLGALDALGLEAVLFREPAPRRLALYAAEPTAVRLEAEGVTTEEIAPGYWLGRLAPHLRGALAVKVRVGEREAAWSLRVGPREKR